jgi:hypothetical protein
MKNKGRKMGDTICSNCGKTFQKPISEIKRNSEKGRPNFCSRRCVGLNNVKNLSNTELYDISKHSGNREDKNTKFRYHYRNILKRNQIVDITIEDLKEQWEKQNGICEFTGVKLILSTYSKIEKSPIYTASLDRIDSTKGYVKDNIRWVSRSINWMKNDMSDEMVWELCRLISENYKQKQVVV